MSIDVEDPRDDLPDGERFPPHVPKLVDAFLRLLARHDGRATFFILGSVARRHPDMVRRIVAEGHEVGCHSDTHVPLDRRDPASLADDLSCNLEALYAAGAQDVVGYRAPCFSLNEASRWAYPVLAKLGFRYSSSVLPARNPLYGWPAFGTKPRFVDGMLEMPVSLLRLPMLQVPVGGVYFRSLPRAVLRHGVQAYRRHGRPILGYHHPYDIDTQQPFAHPAFPHRSLYGLLMRANRAAVIPRLEMIHELGFRFAAYGRLAGELRNMLAPGKGRA